MEQRSKEWYEARRGRITGSLFSEIITPKGSISASATKAISRVVAEILTNNSDLDELMGDLLLVTMPWIEALSWKRKLRMHIRWRHLIR